MKKVFLTVAFVFIACAVNAQSKIVSEPVSENEQVTSPKVKIFPNPATNVINVLGLLNCNVAKITLTNVYGNTVLEHQWEIRNNSLNIPISNLEAGIYLIAIRSDKQMVRKKFYKQ